MAIIPRKSIIDSSPTLTRGSGYVGSLPSMALIADAAGGPKWDTHSPDQSSHFMKEFTGFEAWTADPQISSNAINMVDGYVYVSAVYLDHPAVIQTLYALQATQGSYNADNNNKFGIYKYDKTSQDFTLIAATANTSTLFKGTTNSSISAALTTQVSLFAGWYFLAMLFNTSDVTPAVNPSVYSVLGGSSGAQNIMQGLRAFYITAQQTDLPSTFNWSSTSIVSAQRWMGMY